MTQTTNQNESNQIVRNYKDTLFRMIFREKKDLLTLYNAVNGTHYTDPEQLEIVTLENAIYMNMKNDLAFIIELQIHLYEHQSTYNPNMPLRNLMYFTREVEKLIDKKTLYSSVMRKIPTPHFVVFYNGTDELPERDIYKLSDAFEVPTEELELELKVLMLNVNHGKNAEIMEACKTLKDYSIYVDKVRTYAEKMPIEKAVDRAVEECIKEGVLEDFLRKYRAEVKQVSICEYDHEKEMKMIREDEREVGRQAGILEGRRSGISEGKQSGLQAGKQQGLKALVSTLKPILVDFDEVYQAIKKNEEYADVTEEEVRKYF